MHAFFERAIWKSSRTMRAPSPTYFCTSSEPMTRMKHASVRFATARAESVFPVPGGPYLKKKEGIKNNVIIRVLKKTKNEKTKEIFDVQQHALRGIDPQRYKAFWMEQRHLDNLAQLLDRVLRTPHIIVRH